MFLDPDTNEWVLAEFLGTWWFDKSKRTCGSANWEHTHTAETKARIAATVRGQKRSAEARAKISEAARNRPSVSDETRAKLSEAGRNRPPISDEARAKISDALRGRTLSDETKAKISEAARLREARKRLRRMAKWDSLIPNFED